LVIAGSGASPELKREVAKAFQQRGAAREHSTRRRSTELVRNAQVNVLPTFQATGIKLKLLLCLFTGRHVVCNSPMVEGTGLESLCHVHDEPEAMRLSIQACMGVPVRTVQRSRREPACWRSVSATSGTRKDRELVVG
jgi:hypothetical protein